MATNDYWKNRAIQRLVGSEIKGLDIMKNILPIYDQALKNINSEINKVYVNYAKKVGLDVIELTKILVGADKNNFLKSIQQNMKTLGFNVGDIYDKQYLNKITRLEAIKQQVYWQIRELAVPIERVQTVGYKKIVKDSYEVSRRDVREQLGASGSFATIDQRTTDAILSDRWLGGNFKTRTGINAHKFATKVRDVIGGGLIAGIGEEKMRRQIRERFDVGRYDTMRLVRTETNYIQNQAELQSLKDEDATHYTYEAVMDGITSQICRGLHGIVYPLEEAMVGENYPPMHPNCRSTIVIGFASEYNKQEALRGERDAEKLQGDTKPYHTRKLDTEADLDRYQKEYLELKDKDNYMAKNLTTKEYVEYVKNLPKPKITDAEKRAISQYAGGHFQPINTYLRKGKDAFLMGSSVEEIQGYIKNIDSLIDKSSLTESIKVYRGFGKFELRGLKIGDSLTDKAYVSTSLSENLARRFGNSKSYAEIRLPKGSKAIHIKKYYDSIDGAEQELLLPRGVTLVVEGIEKVNGMDKYILIYR